MHSPRDFVVGNGPELPVELRPVRGRYLLSKRGFVVRIQLAAGRGSQPRPGGGRILRQQRLEELGGSVGSLAGASTLWRRSACREQASAAPIPILRGTEIGRRLLAACDEPVNIVLTDVNDSRVVAGIVRR